MAEKKNQDIKQADEKNQGSSISSFVIFEAKNNIGGLWGGGLLGRFNYTKFKKKPDAKEAEGSHQKTRFCKAQFLPEVRLVGRD